MATARAGHPAIAALSGVVALSAWAGGALLLAGLIDFGDEVTGRLPFHSATVAAAALLIVVAVPMTLTAWLSARSGARWRVVGAVAGTMLIGWIVVQLAFIQTFTWLQPVMAAAGAAVLAAAVLSR